MGKPVRTVGRLIQLLAALLIVGILCFGIQETIILCGSGSDLKTQPDAVIILGCKIWGEEPSPALRSRLNTALDYLEELKQEGCNPVIVVSGGQGEDEPISEAECMAKYLADNGIPAQRIRVEAQSTNTAENLRNSMALLEGEGWNGRAVTIVSNGFHLTRVRLLSGRILADMTCSTLSAPMPTWDSAVYSTVREAFALVKSFLLDR